MSPREKTLVTQPSTPSSILSEVEVPPPEVDPDGRSKHLDSLLNNYTHLEASKYLERCRNQIQVPRTQNGNNPWWPGTPDPKPCGQRYMLSESPQRFFERNEETLHLWRAVHRLNGLVDLPGTSTIAKDCLTGDTFPEWSHIVPYSEQWITGLVIWLREVGVLDNNSAIAERWKVSFYNMVPNIKWMGQLMEYQYGGLLIMPTKQCLWRLCIQAQAAIFAFSGKRKQYSEFDPKEHLLAGWNTEIPKEGMPVIRDGEMHFIGQEYAAAYPSDYPDEHLFVKAVKKADGFIGQDVVQTANVFEVHYILVKNQRLSDKSGHEKELVPIRDENAEQLVMRTLKLPAPKDFIESSKEDDEIIEVIKWKPDFDPKTCQKGLPQKARKIVSTPTLRETIPLPEGGPTMFVPFDPISAILIFWATARRLLYHKKEGYYIASDEFGEIMELAAFFLRLVEITSPDQLWAVNATAPECFKDRTTLPFGLDPPTDCSRQKRKSYRERNRDFGTPLNEITVVRAEHDTEAYTEKAANENRKRLPAITFRGGVQTTAPSQNLEDTPGIKKPTKSVPSAVLACRQAKHFPHDKKDPDSDGPGPGPGPGQSSDRGNGANTGGWKVVGSKKSSSSHNKHGSSSSGARYNNASLDSQYPIVPPFFDPDKYNLSHNNPQASVDALDDCIADLFLKKQLRFDSWLEEEGTSKALEMQRTFKQEYDDEDAEIARLWNGIQSIKGSITENGKACNGHCFASICTRIPEEEEEEETAQSNIEACKRDSVEENAVIAEAAKADSNEDIKECKVEVEVPIEILEQQVMSGTGSLIVQATTAVVSSVAARQAGKLSNLNRVESPSLLPVKETVTYQFEEVKQDTLRKFEVAESSTVASLLTSDDDEKWPSLDEVIESQRLAAKHAKKMLSWAIKVEPLEESWIVNICTGHSNDL